MRQSGVEHNGEFNAAGIYDDLTSVFEIDRDLAADVRLYLPEAPLRRGRISDEHTGMEEHVRFIHGGLRIFGVGGVSADGSSARQMVAKPDLIALLGSRICHDLISPLGAIANGVELLTMSGGGSSAELSLISDSVESANARVRFFRIAYGAASASSTLNLAEIKQILADVGRNSRMRVSWEPTGPLPRARVKLAFLLLQCFESALPYGGEVRVAQKIHGWEMTGGAERLKVDARLWELLETPAAETELVPANVHFALVAEAAKEARAKLDVEVRSDAIRVAF